MIVYDKEQKQIVIPNGLGNVIIINGGGDCPECPECPEQPGCNLGEGEFVYGTSDVGRYELNASDDGYDGWSKIYLEIEGEAIKVHRASDLLDSFNNDSASLDYGRNYYVGGEITEIMEVNTQYGNATYILNNGFKIYRGKWIDGNGFSSEDQIKVGAYIVVYGVLEDYYRQLELDKNSQVIAYQECTGGEIISCNLEDKWVTPSMSERDDNGFIVIEESEEFDGLSRVVIDPQTLYNEGVEAGRAEGGGSCNLGVLDWTLDSPISTQKNASDDGYDGYHTVVVRPENVIAQEKENAINDFKNKMKEITITENGTYSIDDQETIQYVEFDGNSYFDTNIPFGENTKIEVAILKTTYEEDEQIIGCAHYDLINDSAKYDAFGIVLGAGLVYGVFGNTKTENIGFSYEEEQILTLDRNGIHSSLSGGGSWIDNSKLDASSIYGTTIGIGKIKSVGDGWMYRGLKGRIRYVKIWTNKDDDSTITLFRPKNIGEGAFGVVNSEGVETGHIENLGEGTATFVDEWVKKYPNGFKRVEVNVTPKISIKEEGLNVWYNDLKRITDENAQINSDWDQALQGETIQNVFPGIPFTISGQAVAKPFFIDAVNGNSTATKIGKLVSSANGTPVSCAVVIIGAFDCKNIQNVDIEAFKYMTDLCFIDGMNGLGESFISPQTINFAYCTNLFTKTNSRKYISNFAESLFNLSTGNKNGINTSTLKFKSAVQERSENADAIALMQSKGWTVEFVSSDL